MFATLTRNHLIVRGGSEVASSDGVIGAAAFYQIAHAIDRVDDFLDPNVVKVVLDRAGHALYFTRAPAPWWRDANGAGITRLP